MHFYWLIPNFKGRFNPTPTTALWDFSTSKIQKLLPWCVDFGTSPALETERSALNIQRTECAIAVSGACVCASEMFVDMNKASNKYVIRFVRLFIVWALWLLTSIFSWSMLNCSFIIIFFFDEIKITFRNGTKTFFPANTRNRDCNKIEW